VVQLLHSTAKHHLTTAAIWPTSLTTLSPSHFISDPLAKEETHTKKKYQGK